MDHLLRPLAPISDEGWKLLDEEARERLTPALGARRLVEFDGPHGWRHSATNLGRTERLGDAPGAGAGVSARRRRVLPLVEARAAFELSRSELEDVDRGADDIDLGSLDSAARSLAAAENAAVLDGWEGAFEGIAARSPHERIRLVAPESYPAALARAVTALQSAGVGGPYGVVLPAEAYRNAIGGTESGFPVATHLREILDGPVVWAPGIRVGAVVSLRGGDFLFECGQDIALGYESHDSKVVRLYLQESFSFHVATPEAAVVLEV